MSLLGHKLVCTIYGLVLTKFVLFLVQISFDYLRISGNYFLLRLVQIS